MVADSNLSLFLGRPETRIEVLVGIERRAVARLPRLAEAWRSQIPIGADLPCHLAKVPTKVLERRSAPEPIAVVDTVDDESRLEHKSMRDHRVVVRVGVLLDFEVLLHLSYGV